jgi:hypothetical protein
MKKRKFNTDIFSSLPQELFFFEIFSFLNYKDVLNISLVCKKANDLCSNQFTWKTLVDVEFPKEKFLRLKDYFKKELNEGDWENIFKRAFIISKKCSGEYEKIFKAFVKFTYYSKYLEKIFGIQFNNLIKKKEGDFKRDIFVFQQLIKKKIRYDNFGEYYGEYANDQRNGYGEFKTPKYTYTGDWVNNKHHGKGKISYKDGCVFKGIFEDDYLHGKTKYISPDGITHELKFKWGEIFEINDLSRPKEIRHCFCKSHANFYCNVG